jgi:hypothetical protein
MPLRATNNSIICRPNYEVQRRMSPMASDGEEIKTEHFGTVKFGRTVEYTNTPGANKMAWGSVIDVGKGAAWMKDRYCLDRILRKGDVIGFDASQYTNWRDGDESLMMLPVDAALCCFNPGDEMPQALGVYIMTVPDEGATRRFVLGKASQERGFVLTNDTKRGEIRISDNPHSKIRYSAERVVSVGSGGMSIGEGGQQALGDTRAYSTIAINGEIKRIRTREPVEIVPDAEAVGLTAVFSNVMSSDAWIKGQRCRFTSWDRVKALATDSATDDECGELAETLRTGT